MLLLEPRSGGLEGEIGSSLGEDLSIMGVRC